MRRSSVRAAAVAAALATGALGAPALAAPSNEATLTYTLADCDGPAGTPTAFSAVKQPSGAAALHLVDGSGRFVVMAVVDVATGETLLRTPGFDHNDLPTLTCSGVHPLNGRLQLVTGLLVPLP